jgi:hypothetical protein
MVKKKKVVILHYYTVYVSKCERVNMFSLYLLERVVNFNAPFYIKLHQERPRTNVALKVSISGLLNRHLLHTTGTPFTGFQ